MARKGAEHRYRELRAELASLLKPEGRMALTIPIGLDAKFAPFHRVYGKQRLPRLLAPFEVVAEEFWAKPTGRHWERVDRAAATLHTSGAAAPWTQACTARGL